LEQYIYYEGIFKKGNIKLNDLIEFMETEEREKFKSIKNEVLNGTIQYIDFNLSVPQNEEEREKLEEIGHIVLKGLSVYFSKKRLQINTEEQESKFNIDQEFRERKMKELGMTEEEKIKNIFITRYDDGLTEYESDKKNEYIEQLEDDKENLYNNLERRGILEKAYVKASEFYTNKLCPGEVHKKIKFIL
jgi:glucan-binding YG repeat protein